MLVSIALLLVQKRLMLCLSLLACAFSRAAYARCAPLVASQQESAGNRSLTDDDLRAMRDAAQTALFAMRDETRQWQPPQRPPGESAQLGGETAFCCWALLESGVAAQDPRLEPALTSTLQSQSMDGTYAIAARVLIRASLLRKSLGKSEPSVRRALEADVAWIASGFSKQSASWGYAHEPSTRLEDNSIRQFVALALLEAQSVGADAPKTLWRSLCQALCAAQAENGGWTYQGLSREEPPRGSITAGLVAALSGMTSLESIARDGRLRANAERSIVRAEQWLAQRFDAKVNPGNQAWWIFWIFALERAAQSRGNAEFGSHDWLMACADALADALFVPSQPGGSTYTIRERLSTDAGGTRVRAVDLATALLFLDRALRPNVLLVWSTSAEMAASRELARRTTNIVEERDEQRAGWWVVDRDELSPTIAARTPVLYVSRDRARKLTEMQSDALRAHAQRGGVVVMNLPPKERETIRSRWRASLDLTEFPVQGIEKKLVRDASVEVLGAPRALLVFTEIDDGPKEIERTATLLASFALPYGSDALPWPTFAHRQEPLALSAPATIALLGDTAQPENAAWDELQSLPSLRVVCAPDIESMDALPLPCAALVHGTTRATPSPEQLDALARFATRGGLVLFESPFGAGDFARRCEIAWSRRVGVEVTTLTPRDFAQTWPALALERLRWRPRALVGIDLQTDGAQANAATALRLRGTRDARGINAVFSREDLSFGLLGVPHAECVGMQPPETRNAVRALLELAILRAAKGGK